jgi:hypothetical protein
MSETWFIQSFIMNVAVFSSVLFLLGLNLYGIIYGGTAVEGIDNDDYREEAEARNEVLIKNYPV